MFNMGIVLDDLSDQTEFRMGKKSWYKICEGGPGAAIYDGALIGWLTMYLLQKHFKNDPGYIRMMEFVSMVMPLSKYNIYYAIVIFIIY